MSVDVINGFLNFDMSTKISILVGILCYFIMRVGLSQKDNNLLIILIISFFAFLNDILLDFWQMPVSVCVILLACLLRYSNVTEYFFRILNHFELTNKNHHGSTIFEIGNCKYPLAALVVVLKNGDKLLCDNMSLFKDAPTTPILIDYDGSINVYVTRIIHRNNINEKIVNPFDLDQHSHFKNKKLYYVTNIKSSEIEYIQFGFIK